MFNLLNRAAPSAGSLITAVRICLVVLRTQFRAIIAGKIGDAEVWARKYFVQINEVLCSEYQRVGVAGRTSAALQNRSF